MTSQPSPQQHAACLSLVGHPVEGVDLVVLVGDEGEVYVLAHPFDDAPDGVEALRRLLRLAFALLTVLLGRGLKDLPSCKEAQQHLLMSLVVRWPDVTVAGVLGTLGCVDALAPHVSAVGFTVASVETVVANKLRIGGPCAVFDPDLVGVVQKLTEAVVLPPQVPMDDLFHLHDPVGEEVLPRCLLGRQARLVAHELHHLGELETVWCNRLEVQALGLVVDAEPILWELHLGLLCQNGALPLLDPALQQEPANLEVLLAERRQLHREVKTGRFHGHRQRKVFVQTTCHALLEIIVGRLGPFRRFQGAWKCLLGFALGLVYLHGQFRLGLLTMLLIEGRENQAFGIAATGAGAPANAAGTWWQGGEPSIETARDCRSCLALST
mmetsp:Transcript_61007/g.133519  ORF Transcript_61007/g.133519 Transcript_61007/m.133519 type:complete len:382 (+) Transcript_61007:218-1363(+)